MLIAIQSFAPHRGSRIAPVVHAIGAAIWRLWLSFQAGTERRVSVAELEALHDRQLEDIGLSRADIKSILLASNK